MAKHKNRLTIGITMGDVGGIGPELIVRAFQDPRLREMATWVLYGPTKALNIYRKALEVEKFSYNIIERPDQAQPKRTSVIDTTPNFDRVEIGTATEAGGTAAYDALRRAVKDLKEGAIHALVTLPIDKATIQSDKFDFPGHTEYLTKSFEKEESLMFMLSEHTKVGVVTGHIPVKQISEHITINAISQKLKLMNKSLKKDFKVTKPRIAVLGLNPHAGDGGLLGKEDKEQITKAIQKAENEGIWAMGPYSADGFFGSGTYTKFDAVLAMYHDQGLIPFKILSGIGGVNYTAGLQGIRTSPDHGVAYSLAGKGKASLMSFQQAIFAAIDIYRNRQDAGEEKPKEERKPAPQQQQKQQSTEKVATEGQEKPAAEGN